MKDTTKVSILKWIAKLLGTSVHLMYGASPLQPIIQDPIVSRLQVFKSEFSMGKQHLLKMKFGDVKEIPEMIKVRLLSNLVAQLKLSNMVEFREITDYADQSDFRYHAYLTVLTPLPGTETDVRFTNPNQMNFVVPSELGDMRVEINIVEKLS